MVPEGARLAQAKPCQEPALRCAEMASLIGPAGLKWDSRSDRIIGKRELCHAAVSISGSHRRPCKRRETCIDRKER